MLMYQVQRVFDPKMSKLGYQTEALMGGLGLTIVECGTGQKKGHGKVISVN
jgi:hypothetical protein